MSDRRHVLEPSLRPVRVATADLSPAEMAATLVSRGRIRDAAAVVGSFGPCGVAVARARIALEQGDWADVKPVLDKVGDRTAAYVLEADLAVRSGSFDEHFPHLVKAVQRSTLTPLQRGYLGLQVGEIAMVTDHTALAIDSFRDALKNLGQDPLLEARCRVGLSVLAGSYSFESTSGSPLRALDAVAHAIGDRPTTATNAILRNAIGILTDEGLIDLATRLRAILATRRATQSMVEPTSPILAGVTPSIVAVCPWVPTEALYDAYESAFDQGVDLPFWGRAIEIRTDRSYHVAQVEESHDVVAWAEAIRRQSRSHAQLTAILDQTRERWRDLANLASNEIRGLLTSLAVAAELRTSGMPIPDDLELAIVRRVNALATMTLLSSAGIPTNAENPCKPYPVRPLLASTAAQEQSIFDWQGRTFDVEIDVADGVLVAFDPQALSDLIRWTIIAASTGALGNAAVSMSAVAEAGMLTLRIVAISDNLHPPPDRRALGMSNTTSAHRAATALMDVWGGTFSVSYQPDVLLVEIGLPTADDRYVPPDELQMWDA